MEPDSTGNEDIRRFEEQFRRNPDSLVFARLADACRKAGDPERALSILQDGIQRHPDYASAHIVRARALNDLDRRPEAEASLRRVLELDAQNLVAMRGLAGLAERRGDPVEAVHWFERIVAHDPANAEAVAALHRLRHMLPETPPGLEPLPAPREEWWSSPAFEIVDEATAEEADLPPSAETGTALPAEESEPAASRSGGAWWFEDPDGDESAEDDGDLLTRTMAELYVKQGLVDEATAIYRELLADRPADEDLRQALAELEADGEELEAAGHTTAAARGAAATAESESADSTEAASAGPTPGPADGEESRDEGEAPSTPEDETTAVVVPTDPYASHPIPATVAESEVFRDWIRRLRE